MAHPNAGVTYTDPIADLTDNKTFLDWRIKTNEVIAAVNDLLDYDHNLTAADIAFTPTGDLTDSTDVQAAILEAYNKATDNAIAYAVVLS